MGGVAVEVVDGRIERPDSGDGPSVDRVREGTTALAVLDGDIRLVCVLQFRSLAVQRGRRLDDVTRLVGKAEPLTVILTRCAALDERRESVGTALTTVPHG